MKDVIKAILFIALIGFCLFAFALHHQSSVFRFFESAVLSLQGTLLTCLLVWCGTVLFLTFRLEDLSLVALVVIAVVDYFVVSSATEAVTLVAGITLGKGAVVLLGLQKGKVTHQNPIIPANHQSEVRRVLTVLVMLLAFSSCWHLNMSDNFYRGPRWMGLWNNPNDYGMLMSAGFMLAVGLLATERHKLNVRFLRQSFSHSVGSSSVSRCSCEMIHSIILFIAAGMMAVGLLFSYSRGAWIGATSGLLYLTTVYGKFKWRFVLSMTFFVVVVVWLFWNSTLNTAPWFVKRMDFGRPSAQHRVDAWRGAFQIMRDHPFGVGWGNAVETYENSYSPPEGAAGAIITNDYLMLGTQLGIPALFCLVVYVAFCFRGRVRRPLGDGLYGQPPNVGQGPDPTLSPLSSQLSPEESVRIACRAGSLSMLVSFWFDDGLFKLATASVFWILLELGKTGFKPLLCGRLNQKPRCGKTNLANIVPHSDKVVC